MSFSGFASPSQLSMPHQTDVVPNGPPPPKMPRFDYQDVYLKMKSSSVIDIFDPLQDTPRIWIGQFERVIEAASGNLELHAFSILAFFLPKDHKKWHLRMRLDHPDADWVAIRSQFINHFEKMFGDAAFECLNRWVVGSSLADFVKKRTASIKSLFPSLTQRVIFFHCNSSNRLV